MLAPNSNNSTNQVDKTLYESIVCILFFCVALLTIWVTINLDQDMLQYSRIDYPHVYDIGHRLPDLRSYDYVPNLYLILFMGYLLWSPFIIEFIGYIIPIFIARVVVMQLTVLPKTDDGCDELDLSIAGNIFGGCYDKIFSGHFSIVLLITLILQRHRLLSMAGLLLLNGINAVMIISTRAHYTIDIVVSVLVTLFIFQNHITIG